MSGHSKWATIKRKKGAVDAKRGRLFSKIIKELSIAARHGGGDPGGNPRLRTVLEKAKAANMPLENVTRAIKRGTGELDGVIIEETTFEGYGPGGAALMLEVVTDNRNRTVAELRHILTKHGGNLGETNCVGWMFARHGVISFDKKSATEEQLMDTALAAGADDLRDSGDQWDVITDPTNFHTVQDALKEAKLTPASAELQREPSTTVKLEGNDAERMLKLMEALEDHDDVQNVFANFDIDESTMERLAG